MMGVHYDVLRIHRRPEFSDDLTRVACSGCDWEQSTRDSKGIGWRKFHGHLAWELDQALTTQYALAPSGDGDPLPLRDGTSYDAARSLAGPQELLERGVTPWVVAK